MILPRIGLFKSNRMHINHIVLVDGDKFKTMCTRAFVCNGKMVEPTEQKICAHCLNHGWTKSMGIIGASPVDKNENGNYISRSTRYYL